MTNLANKYLPNLSWVSPHLTVRNVSLAAKFYNKAFNFEIDELFEDENGSCWHAELNYKKQFIMLSKEGARGVTTKAPITSQIESSMSLYLCCENVDAFYKSALAAGATSFMAPEDMFWGNRMCKLKDLDGYAWVFTTSLKLS